MYARLNYQLRGMLRYIDKKRNVLYILIGSFFTHGGDNHAF